MDYVLPIALFFILSLVSGIVIVLLSRLFPGETTDITMEIRSELPGLNCGVCGCAGCDDYASGVALSGLAPNLCVPGGNKAVREISRIMDIPYSGDVEDSVAFIRCNGNYGATFDKYDYRGVLSCAASSLFYGGRSSCRFGCLGFGDCAEVCPENAIRVENGCAVIDRDKCVGCLLCARICPQKIIVKVPRSALVEVECSSLAHPREIVKTCKNGCISCKRCERVCKTGAVTVSGFLARIDHTLCDNCGSCAKVCPTGCIGILLESRTAI